MRSGPVSGEAAFNRWLQPLASVPLSVSMPGRKTEDCLNAWPQKTKSCEEISTAQSLKIWHSNHLCYHATHKRPYSHLHSPKSRAFVSQSRIGIPAFTKFSIHSHFV
jgi:hypothetical protein